MPTSTIPRAARRVSCAWLAGALCLVLFAEPAFAAKPAAKLPPLPEPIASFGAVVADGWLYVYSGHTGEAHAHSKQNLSQKFQRLNLNAASEWEALPVGPALQSPALVAHDGAIYRIGGLTAHNNSGEAEQLESVRDFARYDVKAKKWTDLTPLPEGRSSHDAVVVGDKLYVVGGWDLGKERKWHKTALVYDFAKPEAGWTKLPEQTFERRAIAVAALDGKVYALGGMTSANKPSSEVTYFDVAKNAWVEGPALPATMGMAGFGCGAIAAGGKLYATTMDGSLFCLQPDGSAWDKLGTLEEPRFLHRLVPAGDDGLLAVGGASHTMGHLDSIERFSPVEAK